MLAPNPVTGVSSGPSISAAQVQLLQAVEEVRFAASSDLDKD